jgi:hypothetical protein
MPAILRRSFVDHLFHLEKLHTHVLCLSKDTTLDMKSLRLTRHNQIIKMFGRPDFLFGVERLLLINSRARQEIRLRDSQLTPTTCDNEA